MNSGFSFFSTTFSPFFQVFFRFPSVCLFSSPVSSWPTRGPSFVWHLACPARFSETESLWTALYRSRVGRVMPAACIVWEYFRAIYIRPWSEVKLIRISAIILLETGTNSASHSSFWSSTMPSTNPEPCQEAHFNSSSVSFGRNPTLHLLWSRARVLIPSLSIKLLVSLSAVPYILYCLLSMFSFDDSWLSLAFEGSARPRNK